MRTRCDRRSASWTLACLAALAGACGAPPPRVPTATEVERLPAVSVSVAPEVEPERVRAFEGEDGGTLLRTAVLGELADRSREGGVAADELRVVVTRFRLRSTGTGVWLGGMAGADMLEVDVTLVRAGQATRTFHTGAGGLAAGLVKPTASGRMNGLVRLVAVRIVEGL